MCCACGGGSIGDSVAIDLPELDQIALDAWLSSEESISVTHLSDQCTLDITTVYHECLEHKDSRILFAGNTCQSRSVTITLYISETDIDKILATSDSQGPIEDWSIESGSSGWFVGTFRLQPGMKSAIAFKQSAECTYTYDTTWN